MHQTRDARRALQRRPSQIRAAFGDSGPCCAPAFHYAKFVENRICKSLQAVFQKLSKYQKSSNNQRKSKSIDFKIHILPLGPWETFQVFAWAMRIQETP